MMKYLRMNILSALTGASLGFCFPLLLIFFDLNQLSMEFSYANFRWVLFSQNAITYSFYGFPIIFAIEAVLINMYRQKSRELLRAQEEVNAMAHAAGMAEIASEVIHNIGNVLTAIFAYVDKILMTTGGSQYKTANKAKEMLATKQELLKLIADEDPEFVKLIEFYDQYGDSICKEMDTIQTQTTNLKSRIFIIRDILRTQQSYAHAGSFMEKASINSLIETSLKILSEKIDRYSVQVFRDYEAIPNFPTAASKVINVLTNILKNAIEAMGDLQQDRIIRINTSYDKKEEKVIVVVRDSGSGIPKEHLDQVFLQRFTTKDQGQGLGLHSCFNLVGSLGGRIKAENHPNGGAMFIVELPTNRGKASE